MVKLKINDIDDHEFDLEDENNKKYNLILEFLDIEEKISIGDYIYIDEMLLDPKYEGYSRMYTFGYLDNKYGRANITLGDVDVIKVQTLSKEIILKRLYG